jgi:hypothetical protein
MAIFGLQEVACDKQMSYKSNNLRGFSTGGEKWSHVNPIHGNLFFNWLLKEGANEWNEWICLYHE